MWLPSRYQYVSIAVLCFAGMRETFGTLRSSSTMPCNSRCLACKRYAFHQSLEWYRGSVSASCHRDRIPWLTSLLQDDLQCVLRCLQASCYFGTCTTVTGGAATLAVGETVAAHEKAAHVMHPMDGSLCVEFPKTMPPGKHAAQLAKLPDTVRGLAFLMPVILTDCGVDIYPLPLRYAESLIQHSRPLAPWAAFLLPIAHRELQGLWSSG